MMPNLRCPTCATPIRPHEKNCPSCDCFCGYPNVRKAEEAVEADELRKRYDSAVAAAAARSRGAVLASYENVLADSVAVVCRSLDRVKALLSSDDAVYSTFYREVLSGARRPADSPVETQRAATDARVFPQYQNEMRFAALSLNGRGVPVYGECSLVLKSMAIAARATVFWENTVDFCNRVCPEQNKPVPPGYRAPWPMRATLAAAKGEPLLDRQATTEEFSRILLDGDRFVEVNIHGPFNRNSFDRILIGTSPLKRDRAMISAIRDVIERDGLGIAIEEYS